MTDALLRKFHEEERIRYQSPAEPFRYTAADGGKSMVSAVVRNNGRTVAKVSSRAAMLGLSHHMIVLTILYFSMGPAHCSVGVC